ncbi:MAG TPA: glutathione S-transferase C-terminal domain-containing protein, partial [Hyphomonadaceae bacterium]
ANLERRLAANRFITGDRFTAADVAMAGNMGYVMQQGWLPKRPGFEDYVTRATDRPAFKRAQEKDQALAMKVPALAAMLQKR